MSHPATPVTRYVIVGTGSRANMYFRAMTGTYADRIFFRIPRDEQASVLEAHPGVRLFEPMAGRPMRDHLDIEAAAANRRIIVELLAFSWTHAQDLPLKVKKAKRT